MKEGITIRAQSVEKAIHLALEHLGLQREEVEIRVLEDPATEGFEEALVQVAPRPASPSPAAGEAAPGQVGQEILADLLRYMGIQAEVAVDRYALAAEQPQVLLNVTTTSERDSGLLIGRRGETLQRLQFLLNLLVNRRLRRWPYLLVDVEHYRRRRDASLQDLAGRMAERVHASQQPITLEPMPPYERRVVHLALRDNPLVVTQSTGEGDNRKVVIYPAQWDLPPTSSS